MKKISCVSAQTSAVSQQVPACTSHGPHSELGWEGKGQLVPRKGSIKALSVMDMQSLVTDQGLSHTSVEPV